MDDVHVFEEQNLNSEEEAPPNPLPDNVQPSLQLASEEDITITTNEVAKELMMLNKDNITKPTKSMKVPKELMMLNKDDSVEEDTNKVIQIDSESNNSDNGTEEIIDIYDNNENGLILQELKEDFKDYKEYLSKNNCAFFNISIDNLRKQLYNSPKCRKSHCKEMKTVYV